MRHKSSIEDFWSHVQRHEGNECWPWLGPLTLGYGSYTWGGRSQHAHRVAVLISGVVIPRRYHAHHTCENRACVRPSHMKVLSPGDHAHAHGKTPAHNRYQFTLIRPTTEAAPESHFSVVGFRTASAAYHGAYRWMDYYTDHTRITVKRYQVAADRAEEADKPHHLHIIIAAA